MRKEEIESVEDLEALPEDEWVEVPEGLHAACKVCLMVKRITYL